MVSCMSLMMPFLEIIEFKFEVQVVVVLQPTRGKKKVKPIKALILFIIA